MIYLENNDDCKFCNHRNKLSHLFNISKILGSDSIVKNFITFHIVFVDNTVSLSQRTSRNYVFFVSSDMLLKPRVNDSLPCLVVLLILFAFFHITFDFKCLPCFLFADSFVFQGFVCCSALLIKLHPSRIQTFDLYYMLL